MCKLFVTLIMLLAFYGIGNAQLQPKKELSYQLFPKKEKSYLTPPSKSIIPAPLQKGNPLIIIPSTPSIMQTPNSSVVALQNPFAYSHSNGRGFDVYKSGVDNMPVLMPDKENAASLGMAKKEKTNTKTELPEVVVPYNGPSFLR